MHVLVHKSNHSPKFDSLRVYPFLEQDTPPRGFEGYIEVQIDEGKPVLMFNLSLSNGSTSLEDAAKLQAAIAMAMALAANPDNWPRRGAVVHNQNTLPC